MKKYSRKIRTRISKSKYVLLALLVAFSFSCSSDDDGDVAPSLANRIEISSGSNQSAVIGTELANPIKMVIKDQYGRPFEGAMVSFSVAEGSIFSSTSTSDANGIVTNKWVLGNTVGSQLLTASVFMADGVTPLSGSPLIITATGLEVPCQTLMNSTVLPVGPDSGTITNSIINVPDSFTVRDINVTLNINHTWVADLEIFLIAPDGITIVELTTDNGGSGDNLVNTVFDDDATLLIVNITSADAPFTNRYQPEGSLATFNGLQSNGNWTLRITDDSDGDSGSLINWSLEICGY